ncbi:MAG: hypothetical protein ACYC5M_14670 [Anaerolineae bacterium]
MAWLIQKGPLLLGWELAWVNAVFSFWPAWYYAMHPGHSETTTKHLVDHLAGMPPDCSVRTIWDGALELIGTLERTPIGLELGQGIVSPSRPRTVRRIGLSDPHSEAIGHAMRRLFQRERSSELRYEEELMWPWVVFGCDRDEAILSLTSVQHDWLDMRTDSARLLKSREELDGLALF